MTEVPVNPKTAQAAPSGDPVVEYHTARGCLVLGGISIACVAILIFVVMLVMDKPA